MTGSPAMTAKCIFSVDVEDWFHILALPQTPDVSQWSALPSHVEANFRQMLELCEGVRMTCFFLGWVAERFPHLVREAAAAGHEIASHGYAHRLTYTLSPQEFGEDVTRSKHILEDIIGREVHGYRCPGFSVTAETPWFFEQLVQAGYRYDSSIFPAARLHGGMRTDRLGPHRIATPSGSLTEFPITVARVLGKPVCFFGGGYLRLFPYPITRLMGERVLAEGRPVVFYVHPREIDPSHPRLAMSAGRRFRSYVGLKTTRSKIQRILRDFDVGTFSDYLTRQPALETAA
jgi:polysaccharide deacetylase family protein (PEP-CTERM system associated)